MCPSFVIPKKNGSATIRVVTVNISKSKFFAEQIEYLTYGYWINRQGIQSIRKKVEMNAILNIKAPKTRKEEQTTPVY
jgi:hypothetical protein